MIFFYWFKFLSSFIIISICVLSECFYLSFVVDIFFSFFIFSPIFFFFFIIIIVIIFFSYYLSFTFFSYFIHTLGFVHVFKYVFTLSFSFVILFRFSNLTMFSCLSPSMHSAYSTLEKRRFLYNFKVYFALFNSFVSLCHYFPNFLAWMLFADHFLLDCLQY